MSSIESKKQFLDDLEKELEYERNLTWQHTQYFLDNHNTEEDLKIDVIKRRWREYPTLVDELTDINFTRCQSEM